MLRRRDRRGFTLVELLLVLAIIGIVTAVTMPYMVKSIKGNRLRTAARTVAMAGRYARSMAVMKQSTMALQFNLDSAKVSVRTVSRPRTPAGAAGPGGTDLPDLGTQSMAQAASPGTGEVSTVVSDSDSIEERFEKIRIAAVDVEDPPERFEKGTCLVLYDSNGTCTPYEVRLVDEDGSECLITVDRLSSVSTEMTAK